MSGGTKWEERWHPLREEWVIIAAHRQDRPWSGETVTGKAGPGATPDYVEDCYLCPGNPRVGGHRNENYSGIYVFDNDHPCVGENAPGDLQPPAGVYRNRPASGLARVLCYSPKHNLTLAELELSEIENLLIAWRDQYADLGARPEVNHVLTFENKGEVVGVSNPHPHCQLYATNFVFKTIENEAQVCRRHFEETGHVLFQDILKAEREDSRRVIYENSSAIAFMPYFARYAYECYVAPRETHSSLTGFSREELSDFADALGNMVVRYDNLWRMPFPYVMTLHQAPTDGADYSSFHFHVEFHPPLRKPHLLKYLAGPEIGGGNFLGDTLPEDKAQELPESAGPALQEKGMSVTDVPSLLGPLRRLHENIRDAVVEATERQNLAALSEVRREESSDTIYALDVVSEDLLMGFFEKLSGQHSFVLLAEGLESGQLVFPPGTNEAETSYRIIVDPIDGTRGLMYQKRSGWILTGVAPNRGPETSLRDIVLAVQTEIPLVKQHLSDQLWAVRGQGAMAERYNRLTGERVPIHLRPSTAGTIEHGFAMISRFFPGVRDELAAIDDEIVVGALGPTRPGRALCFEDQYISSGGQLYELMAGHDRFVADLRPLMEQVVAARGQRLGICCHPYDLCTALIAVEMGISITDLSGDPLNPPLDITTEVGWAGYANARIRQQIEPLLQNALRRRGLI